MRVHHHMIPICLICVRCEGFCDQDPLTFFALTELSELLHYFQQTLFLRSLVAHLYCYTSDEL